MPRCARTAIVAALAAALFTTAWVGAARAAISSSFDSGAGVNPDTFVGSAGSGWAGAWQELATTGTVVNTSPLDGATYYLADTSAGGGVFSRQYTDFGSVDVTMPHTISWKFRYDGNQTQFTAFEDRINFMGNASAAASTTSSNSWMIIAAGAPQGGTIPSAANRFFVYDNPATSGLGGFVSANLLDTGVPFVAGNTYRFSVDVDPANRSYSTTIVDETDLVSYTGVDLGFRNQTGSGAQHTFINLGTVASTPSDSAQFSIDSVRVTGPHDLSISTADGQGADAYVRQGNSGNNFGADELLGSKATDIAPANRRKTYLRFDLSDIPSGPFNVSNAQLSLHVREDLLGICTGACLNMEWKFNVYGLTNESLDNWIEGAGTGSTGANVAGIDWLNAPANDTASNGVTGGATLLGSFSIIGDSNDGKMVNFSSDALLAFLNSDSNGVATFIIVRDSLGDTAGGDTVIHFFASKELAGGLLAPTLDLTYGQIPEPATATLALLGVASLLRRRRRAA